MNHEREEYSTPATSTRIRPRSSNIYDFKLCLIHQMNILTYKNRSDYVARNEAGDNRWDQMNDYSQTTNLVRYHRPAAATAIRTRNRKNADYCLRNQKEEPMI